MRRAGHGSNQEPSSSVSQAAQLPLHPEVWSIKHRTRRGRRHDCGRPSLTTPATTRPRTRSTGALRLSSSLTDDRDPTLQPDKLASSTVRSPRPAHHDSPQNKLFIYQKLNMHLPSIKLNMSCCLLSRANVVVQKQLQEPASNSSCIHLEFDISGTGLVFQEIRGSFFKTDTLRNT